MKDSFGGTRPTLFGSDDDDMTLKGNMRHSIRPRVTGAAQAVLDAEEETAPVTRRRPNPRARQDAPQEKRRYEAPHKAEAAPEARPVERMEEPQVLRPATDEAPRRPHVEPVEVEAPVISGRGHRAPNQNAPHWQELLIVETGETHQFEGATPLVDYHRDGPTSRAFDLLRTRLRKTMQDNGWTNIALCSPTAGCGNTFTTVNLALSLSRIPKSRTVLMDMNMRAPGVADALQMNGRGPLRDFLDGTVPMRRHMVRISDTLAVGLNRDVEENAPEILQDPTTAMTFDRMRAALRPEIVLYDMPPMLAHDDLSAFLPQLDGVMMVSDGTKTSAKQLIECERLLEGQVPLLGVILNRARASSIKRYG